MNKIILLGCILFLGSAWWELGHMLTAQIAYESLSKTPAAAAKFNQLIICLNKFTDGKSSSFAEAAVWADDIKDTGATFFNDYHFTDLVYDPGMSFAVMSQEQRDINAVNEIEWAMKVLNLNKDGLSFQRAFMARMLLHLVGDIHQPLHSVSMYNATYKTGDMGGNLQRIISVKEESLNLHAYFDSIANLADLNTRFVRPLNDSGKQYIKALTSDIMTKYPLQKLKERMQNNPTPKTWAVESLELAKKSIYPFFANTNKVTQEYENSARDICYQQLAIGGYRLAALIASIYP